jgi:hypothetical protein
MMVKDRNGKIYNLFKKKIILEDINPIYINLESHVISNGLHSLNSTRLTNGVFLRIIPPIESCNVTK